MIGEEGDVDVSKIDGKYLVDGFDQKVFDIFGGKLSEQFSAAKLEDLTVWVDPLDGTQVNCSYLLFVVKIIRGSSGTVVRVQGKEGG